MDQQISPAVRRSGWRPFVQISLVTHADLGRPGWNDIVADGRGRVYVNGAGFNPVAGESFQPGSVSLVTADGSVRQVADDIASPNGMAVTGDNATFAPGGARFHGPTSVAEGQAARDWQTVISAGAARVARRGPPGGKPGRPLVLRSRCRCRSTWTRHRASPVRMCSRRAVII